MNAQLIEGNFDHARHKALVRDLWATVARRSNDLIPYHEVGRLAPEGETYRGLKAVPIERIVGSGERHREFDRSFLPRQSRTKGRWLSIDRAHQAEIRLPPVQLAQIGDVYFVKDGNHRVSVARERGVEFIDAEVIEEHVRAPFVAGMTHEELLRQAEYAEFLRRTDLDRLRPDHDIRPTAAGAYEELWAHVRRYHRWLSADRRRPVTDTEAAAAWYDDVYLPIVRGARERGLTTRFRRRSAADLYLRETRDQRSLTRHGGHRLAAWLAHDIAALPAENGAGQGFGDGLRRLGRVVAGIGGPIRPARSVAEVPTGRHAVCPQLDFCCRSVPALVGR